MRAAVALVNLLLGIGFVAIGVLAILDLAARRRTLGFSHFGAAMTALAFTCGPHHVEHGLHVAFTGRMASPLDLVTVLPGLVAGFGFLALRLEAVAGGRGDRQFASSPLWLRLLSPAAASYVTALVIAGALVKGRAPVMRDAVLPNGLLMLIYATIGVALVVAQRRNRMLTGAWSMSGMMLAGIFLTCVPMHGVWALHRARGLFEADAHVLVIDWLGVPAGLYFLWVVRSVWQGRLRDWNRASPQGAAPAVAPAAR